MDGAYVGALGRGVDGAAVGATVGVTSPTHTGADTVAAANSVLPACSAFKKAPLVMPAATAVARVDSGMGLDVDLRATVYVTCTPDASRSLQEDGQHLSIINIYSHYQVGRLLRRTYARRWWRG